MLALLFLAERSPRLRADYRCQWTGRRQSFDPWLRQAISSPNQSISGGKQRLTVQVRGHYLFYHYVVRHIMLD